MLTCAVVDDNFRDLGHIKEHIKRMPGIQLLQAFDVVENAATFLKINTADILIIDINMHGVNEINLKKILHHQPLVIITTAYRKSSVKNIEAETIEYLMKPVTFDRFRKAVLKTIDFYHYKNNPQSSYERLFIRSDYSLIQIVINDIEYIEKKEDYIKIHYTNALPQPVLMNMKKMMLQLPQGKFKKVHADYIVAVAKIKSISDKKVLLVTGKELPLLERYKRAL